jgi:hypothetical protein
MGKDDLFHKRKLRSAKELERRKASRSPYDRVLIVCEGAKTEPNYFAALRTKLRLNRQNVVIADKKGGLDPKGLVEYAIEEFEAEPDFNHVYCVFDKDKHATYAAALDKLTSKRLKGGAALHPITSVPCFEVWLLLHFTYTTKSFDAPLQDSNANLVIGDLKRHLPNYEKGSKDIFGDVSDRTGTAIENAKQLERFHETSGTDNPSTKVYVIVEYLQALGKPK